MAYQVDETNRRPLRSRGSRLAGWATDRVVSLGLSPNAISLLGMVSALAAGGFLAATAWVEGGAQRVCWGLGACLVQGRLLANLLDGMVAVKTGKASPLGEMFNEVPDRFSDLAILIGLGFAANADPFLGALAGGSALLTAYVRAFGASLGQGQDFSGPLAKPQRMFVVTVAALGAALGPVTWQAPLMFGVFALVIVGSLLTTGRRLWRLAQRLLQDAHVS